MKIAFVDLRAQYQNIKSEIDEAISRTLERGDFILGEDVRKFEEDFSMFCGTQYGIGVSSGTAALQLCLEACNITSGDEVITTPFTFTATADAIVSRGAKPVFVDVSPDTGNLNTDMIESAITDKTKAILPVHLYGHPADMTAIQEIAQRYHLIVIEDAAHAHGAIYQGKSTGSLGHAACFSFYPSKVLGSYGDAGIVITNDQGIMESMKALRNHGQTQKHNFSRRGYCERLDNLQAAILSVKLKHLPEWISARREVARKYSQGLSGNPYVILPVEHAGVQHVYHLYVIRVKERDALKENLAQLGISTGIHYPSPLHLLPHYQMLRKKAGDFPHAEQLAGEVLSLPIYAEMTNEQIEAVIAAITDFYR